MAPLQQKQEMGSSVIPGLPFEVVSMDIMELRIAGVKQHYLVTVDHYSDFFEIDQLPDMKAETVILCCKRNFARHGIPKLVLSDNGTHFMNEPFMKFAKEWSFKYATSSPKHPKSNGKAESAIKIAKTLIKKAAKSGKEIFLSLLNWRNTPNKIGSSPVQRLYSRKTRGLLPMLEEGLRPTVQFSVGKKIVANKEHSKLHHDASARKYGSLDVGQPVYVNLQRPNSKNVWEKGEVVYRFSDRSCLLNVNDHLYRRNRVDIRSHVGQPDSAESSDPEVHQHEPVPADVNNIEGDTDAVVADSLPVARRICDGIVRQSTPVAVAVPTTRQGRKVKLPIRFTDYDMN